MVTVNFPWLQLKTHKVCPMQDSGRLHSIILTPGTMNETKEITINGIKYPVAFNMKTIISYEEIADKSYFDSNFGKTTERIALIVAAVLTADEKSKIKVEDVMGNSDLDAVKQISEAFLIILNMSTEFFGIPSVVAEEQPELTEEERKNAKN